MLDIGYNAAFQPTLPMWLGEGTRRRPLASVRKKGLQPPVYLDLVLERSEWLAPPKHLRVAEALG